jgi:uncharacterized protein (TIGR02678 family)
MADVTDALADALAHQRDDERERALRTLLMRPLLTERSPEAALVRRHAGYLSEWLTRETGWVLRVDRECIRLFKRPATIDDATRGLPDFDRNRYTLLCLACAALERAESQITLRYLGERLLEAVEDPELKPTGFRFALESPRERRDLVLICRFLLAIGVLGLVAGDEEAFVNRSGDVLYDVHRKVLAMLPATARGASFIAATESGGGFEARLAALAEDFVADSPEGQRLATRHRLARRLLDDPVTYHDELRDDERAYLATQRGVLSARLAQATGLTAELRAEGTALVDPEETLTDVRMPAVGTEAHTTLLIAEHIARHARDDAGRLHSLRELAAFLRSANDEYGKYWRKDARAPGAESALAEQAVARLEALKLVRRVEAGIQARPALFRYLVGSAQARDADGRLRDVLSPAAHSLAALSPAAHTESSQGDLLGRLT